MSEHQKIPKNVHDLADTPAKSDATLDFPFPVKGPKKDSFGSISSLLSTFRNIGFQATNFSIALDQINSMRGCKIFFGCTSNIISSGLRELICHLVRYKMIDVLVTTGGGVEEDILKTMNPHKLASFDLKGVVLRESGFNRIGNLVVPNLNYFEFETWFTKVLDTLLEDYSEERPLILTPSKFINYLGSKINDQESILYWAHKNQIPIYSPALTDGSIGDMLTFYKKRSSLKLDIVEDIYNMNREAMYEERKTGAIILGAGLIKHHILNANLFRDGLDYCVLINTAVEFDGSDAGASIEESKSWGKVGKESKAVKVFGDASIIFPFLVAGSFLGGVER